MAAIPAEVGGGWSSEGCEDSSDSSMDMADMVTGTRGSVEDGRVELSEQVSSSDSS